MTYLKRTHSCGELTKKHTGKKVVLNGWVANTRIHGTLVFVVLRDRYGKTQVVFDGSKHKDAYEIGKKLRNEYVVAVSGKVMARPKTQINKDFKTGEIEIYVETAELLNEAERMPVEVEGTLLATEETRLKYRFVDLRREEMQKNIILRHKIAKAIRDYFDCAGFLEIETPFMAKSTPEGARDYLVPTRDKGKFFALPQSPQIYKQLLMVAGYDKYFQIVRCMRDEDLRADRQPEFTQLDVEMSFVDEENVFTEIEGCMKQVMKDALGVNIKLPLPRMSYNESMERFGVDKPDTRFGMELIDLSKEVEKCGFGIFENAVKDKGVVKAICVPKAAEFSKGDIKKLEEFVKIFRAKGLVAINVLKEGIESPVSKFIDEKTMEKIVKKCGAKTDDLVLIVADKYLIASAALGNLRNHLAKKLKMIPEGKYNFLWVTEFPFFEFNEETKKYHATHHPFTFPNMEDMEYLKSDPVRVRSRAYDIVLNGIELGSGSIRIHKKDIQARVFDALGLSKEEADTKFGFIMNAFKYGAPPHGGIALGLDRFVAVLAGAETIREVIAFPKSKHGTALMEDAPSEVSKEQLKELGLKLEELDG